MRSFKQPSHRASSHASYSSLISQQGFALILLAVSISLACAYLAYTEKTKSLDWLMYDNLMRFSQLPLANDIAIIDIDDKSLSQLGRWPWSRERHADLLDTLTKAKAQAVVFDVLFPELDEANPASDIRFAKAIRHNGQVILPIYFETLGQQAQVIESPPHPLFYREVSALGHVHLEAEEDGVVRGVFLHEGIGKAFWPHLALAILEQFADDTTHEALPGRRAETHTPPESFVGIVKDHHNLIPMPSTAQGLRHYSYVDVLNGKVDNKTLANNIIFVGATAAGLGDVLTTPLGSMNGVELNAWIFHALRSQQMIQTLPEKTLALITFLCVLGAVFILGRLSPRIFLILSLVGIISLVMLSGLLLLFGKIWLPSSAIIIGLMAFYPLWSWLRAETILRFLREEIDALSALNLTTQDTSQASERANDFLLAIGLTDANADVTPKGLRLSKAFQQAQSSPLLIHDNADFWRNQLHKHSQNFPDLDHNAKGVEVVGRTIAQLNTIKKNDKKHRQLIEKSLSSLQDAVCIADLCGEITFTNQCFKHWFQPEQSDEGLLSLLKRLRLTSGNSWAQVFSKLYETHQLVTEEASLSTHEGKQFLCQASLVNINESYHDTLILTFTDISLLKAAEQARSEALSFLSHDLRSPMVSVLAILDHHNMAKHAQKATLSDTSIAHIESLVRKNLEYAESFLQLSKADALTDINMHPCDLHAVFDASQVHAMALASPKSISVITKRCDEDVWVMGDMSALERALNNLISNAVKFSPEKSVLTLRLEKSAQTATLSIEDQGMGIAHQDQAHIFDRFTRTKSTEAINGAGLGLNFVATVASRHKGRIELNSELNVGSVFSIHLPVLKEEDVFAD